MLCRGLVPLVLLAACCRRASAAMSPCDHVCRGGGCQYEGCTEQVQCPGGACTLERCDYPSCKGGKCVYTRCRWETCGGGKCALIDPEWTVKGDWCQGGKCTVNGRLFPSRISGSLSY
ncbi:hypothetical protein JKP88DRAFT_27463 [Tribonema minus]|uniref:Uncharacterized protein n=1 Tax=Tribonema minus TaxID=303371 RepID=A0A836CJ00_9STRA|nr:hypothetical protein JKP88DRAFT_27463 [Tribonema minus]|eukprot:TRINITY_DN5555_c0_g1_i1.p1 TRINITY_DN5555_c0_g1~~TRINITY_DN5555_c0_g1_i1.p1  ORF type:complete len:118 (+),score=7.82 TRINITY_DN5555_c0_g1_i1:204-557(+)